jgi:hypothetical protein
MARKPDDPGRFPVTASAVLQEAGWRMFDLPDVGAPFTPRWYPPGVDPRFPNARTFEQAWAEYEQGSR